MENTMCPFIYGTEKEEMRESVKKWLFSIIWGFFQREKYVYDNCGHLNWVKQLGGDSNTHSHPFSSSIHWLVGGESNKMKTASQFQIAKRKDSAFHYSLAMVNQAERNCSFGLQKLCNFFTNAFSVQYFLWKACLMWVLFGVVVVVSHTNITSMQDICSPRKCFQNANLRPSIPMERNISFRALESHEIKLPIEEMDSVNLVNLTVTKYWSANLIPAIPFLAIYPKTGIH